MDLASQTPVTGYKCTRSTTELQLQFSIEQEILVSAENTDETARNL